METVGLIIFAALFVLSGINHIRNHAAMAGYTESVLGDCPVKKQLGFLGGAPAGAFLVAVGVGAAFSEPWAFYGIAGFLAVATALFHRNFITDPGGFKGVALAGAALALATLV